MVGDRDQVAGVLLGDLVVGQGAEPGVDDLVGDVLQQLEDLLGVHPVNGSPSNRSRVTNSATGCRRSFVGCLTGLPERHHRRDGVLLRDAEQLLDLRLLGDRHRRDGAAEALAAGGEQHVPDQRVDRGAAHQADPVEVLVGRGDHAEVDADHHHDGGGEHRRDEVRRHLGRGDLLGRGAGRARAGSTGTSPAATGRRSGGRPAC